MNSVSDSTLIRPMTEEDWAVLREIRLAALTDSPEAFGLSHAMAASYDEQQWRDRASNQSQPQFLVAVSDGAAVGLIGDSINSAGEYSLIAMWINPKYRGIGIAGRLIDAIQARAINRGFSRIVLGVSPANIQATNLYRRKGFKFIPEWEPLSSQPGASVQKMEWLDDQRLK